MYCFGAIVNNDDRDNSNDIRTVRRWGYCGKEENKGSNASLGAGGRWRFYGLVGNNEDDIQMMGDGAVRGVISNGGLHGAV